MAGELPFGDPSKDLRCRAQNPHSDYAQAVQVSRFWRLVCVGEPSECWEWLGDKDADGYGVFLFMGKKRGAHEYALSFSTGEKRLDRLDTCHSCDNPSCVNPNHLRFDTRKSNVADMITRGRAGRQGKLTDQNVLDIRERRAEGARQKDLAAQFGVTDGQISMIVRGVRYAHIGGPIEKKNSQYRKAS